MIRLLLRLLPLARGVRCSAYGLDRRRLFGELGGRLHGPPASSGKRDP